MPRHHQERCSQQSSVRELLPVNMGYVVDVFNITVAKVVIWHVSCVTCILQGAVNTQCLHYCRVADNILSF